MKLSAIDSEEAHDAAIARIEELMEALPDTPEAKELDRLATLVDAYESEHFPMRRPDPMTALQFRLEQEGLAPELDTDTYLKADLDGRATTSASSGR